MPNIWTHILFCEELIDSLEIPQDFSDVKKYLNLGAQGPDPFFYHNFWPWKSDQSVNQVGQVLHHDHCGPFLLDLIESATQKSAHTRAYVAGFVTHHVLDRNTHPYIHFLAGYEKNNHQVLEVNIDTVMMERFRNLKTWKNPVNQQIDVGKTLNKEVVNVLDENIKEYFPQTHQSVPSTYIQEAYRDMKLALRILFDPYGWKNKLLGSLVSPFSHQPLHDKKDYLNDQHGEWRHSATNEASTKSFLNLYEEAKDEGYQILQAVFSYWEKPTSQSKNELENLLKNISYDTGKPLEQRAVNQYAKPIV
ncbi:zinc dependent phospholipase C family protein [Pontibacillus marinus]|uniref:Phospholipase C/D domain-containing protein n=1 Tax=Pontibacillus marinus BH030004 = DSM 16465 TaxID=1385511 RepID=A0A0A5HR85_9BACI|nr:zinc dependent phospholipase C family protein [Pontibacillus marinus]KGX86142.1 hypothetical protein N783_12540 [Pontibacillus marinus BH030004 = DSM 16465]